MITTEQIKELRDKTGVSIMQCKKALEEAQGDHEKALIILRKKSTDTASKKADRTFGSGVIAAYVHANGAVGAMVELLCETDFVSKNTDFKTLGYEIAMHVAAQNPEYLSASDISEEKREKAREVFEADVKGKPKDIAAKILEGKLQSYFSERVLLDQSFIKNPELTIKELIDAGVQKFGERIELRRFSRFSVLD